MKPNTENTTNSKQPSFYYIWNYLEWGGAQVYLFGLMKKAKTAGRVTAFMPRGSSNQLLKFLDNLPVLYGFFDTHTDLKPARTIIRKLQRHWNKIVSELILSRFLSSLDFENTVTHVDLAPWQSFLLILWLCQRTRVFITIHNSVLPIPKSRYLLWQAKFRFLARRKNFHLFAANQEAKESLRTLVPKKFYERIAVTYANVDPAEINAALAAAIDVRALKKKFNLPENKFLVFCVGQFIDRKGRWILLEAAKKLLETEREIAFVWISNSRLTESDLKRMESYDLGADFVFIPSNQVGPDHIDLFKLLRVADVFALPSFLEGLPISLLEAMALGIPSVSTNINGIPEAIRHLETGYLINPGSADELVKAIQSLKANRELRDELSVNGRRFVFEKFNEEVVAEIAVARYLESLNIN